MKPDELQGRSGHDGEKNNPRPYLESNPGIATRSQLFHCVCYPGFKYFCFMF